jgi:hypothetical protein
LQIDSLFTDEAPEIQPEGLCPGFAQYGYNERIQTLLQDFELTENPGPLAGSTSDQKQRSLKESARPPARNSRRRDYTKAEKESFERWISVNPKPDRNQKAEFARALSLTEHQLQNLINNRKRITKAIEKKIKAPEACVNVLTISKYILVFFTIDIS